MGTIKTGVGRGDENRKFNEFSAMKSSTTTESENFVNFLTK